MRAGSIELYRSRLHVYSGNWAVGLQQLQERILRSRVSGFARVEFQIRLKELLKLNPD